MTCLRRVLIAVAIPLSSLAVGLIAIAIFDAFDNSKGDRVNSKISRSYLYSKDRQSMVLIERCNEMSVFQ